MAMLIKTQRMYFFFFFGILNNKSHKHLVGEKYSFSCLPLLLTDNEHNSDMTC